MAISYDATRRVKAMQMRRYNSLLEATKVLEEGEAAIIKQGAGWRMKIGRDGLAANDPNLPFFGEAVVINNTLTSTSSEEAASALMAKTLKDEVDTKADKTTVSALQNAVTALESRRSGYQMLDASQGTLPTVSINSQGANDGIKRGDQFFATSAGTVGDHVLTTGDVLVAVQDNPTESSHFVKLDTNLDNATKSKIGLIRIATGTEVSEGTNDVTAVSPLELKNNWTAKKASASEMQAATDDEKYATPVGVGSAIDGRLSQDVTSTSTTSFASSAVTNSIYQSMIGHNGRIETLETWKTAVQPAIDKVPTLESKIGTLEEQVAHIHAVLRGEGEPPAAE